jgi:hypothetical protein
MRNHETVGEICQSAVVSEGQIVAANCSENDNNYNRRRIKQIGILQMNLLLAIGAELHHDHDEPAAPVKQPKYKRGRHPISQVN